MENELSTKRNQILSNKRLLVILGAILIVVAIIIGLYIAMQPQRTVASFCRIAKEQKSILVGDVNYEQRLEAYKKLEAVSPDTIRPDITTIRKGYEEIVKNPANTLGAGFGISSAENRRTDYINTNCKDF